MLTLPHYSIIAVPILVAIITGLFCDDDIAPGANSVISLIILVGFAYFYSSLIYRIVATGDVVTNSVLIAAISAALVGTSLSPLYHLRLWLMEHTTSPLTMLPEITISVRQPAVQSVPPPADPRNSLLGARGRQWVAKPPVTPLPQDDAESLHRVDTLSIPAVTLPGSQPQIRLSSAPSYPPYPQSPMP